MASSKHYERKVEFTLPDVQVRLADALKEEFGEKIELSAPHCWDEYGLTATVQAPNSLEVFSKLKDGNRFKFNMLVDLTAVDWMDKKEYRFEVVYQLLSLTHMHRLCVKLAVGEQKPEIQSVRPLWDSAWFMEREVFDMYGITFAGNGDMRRVLMYEEFVGYPLRKDYPVRAKQPRVQLRVPELRNTSADMTRQQLVALPKKSRSKDRDRKDSRDVPSE